MSKVNQVILFSDYNQLMNQRMLSASMTLSQEDLHKDCGAFFKSLIGTLNHILVGDIIWLKRFATHPSSRESLAPILKMDTPTSLDSSLFFDIQELKTERENVDQVIINWTQTLTEADLNSTITYHNMAGDCFQKQYGDLINHLFLHQVHHRGQASTLLSQFGVDFGETDILEMI